VAALTGVLMRALLEEMADMLLPNE